MSKPTLPAFLRDVGPVVVGITVSVPTPQPTVGRGLSEQGPNNLKELLEGNLEDADFCQAHLAALREVGLVLQIHDRNRRLIKISSIDGSSLELLSDGGEASSHLDVDDPGTAFVELSKTRIAIVLAVARNGVLIDGGSRDVTQIFLPLQPEPWLPLVPPGDWCTANDDSWLSVQLCDVLKRADPIRCVTAVGMYKRLARPQAPCRLLADSVLAGNPVPAFSQPHHWFRALSAPQKRMIERLACERAHALGEDLRHVRANTANQQGITQLLHSREDLEGVRLLLREVGAGQRLEAELANVDRKGIEWIRSAKAASRPNDERLNRVASLDPLAWWATLHCDPGER